MSKELETIKSFQNKRMFDVTYDNGTQKHFDMTTIGDLFPNEIEKIESELKDAEKNKKIVYILKYKLGMEFNTKGIYRLVKEGVLSQEEYDLLNEVFDYE